MTRRWQFEFCDGFTRSAALDYSTGILTNDFDNSGLKARVDCGEIHAGDIDAIIVRKCEAHARWARRILQHYADMIGSPMEQEFPFGPEDAHYRIEVKPRRSVIGWLYRCWLRRRK